MINPKFLKIWSQKFTSRARGEKYYRAGFDSGMGYSHFSRRKFCTATEASQYGLKVKLRWHRLYHAAILQMVQVPIEETAI